MKRTIAVCLLCCLLSGFLAGCAAPAVPQTRTIVAAIFPEYDWIRRILGDSTAFSLKLLCDDGVDPHSFQPTVADLVEVSRCDLLVYGGGESDAWLGDALNENANPGMEILELLPLLGENAYTAEVTEGMQVREDEDELDEHCWLSLRNAMLFCRAITDALCRLDPEGSECYHRNLNEYLQQLEQLDLRYQQTVAAGRTDTLLVCDRFPLRYLVEDYGLNYYAAFPGCSAESGASFATIIFLADRLRELELGSVLVLEGSDGRIARTVAENCGAENIRILTFHSMQAISLADALSADYLTIMEQNRLVLEAALR